MEELCHQLRYLPMLKKWAKKANIRLLCEGRDKDGTTSTVIVSVVSSQCSPVLNYSVSSIQRIEVLLPHLNA